MFSAVLVTAGRASASGHMVMPGTSETSGRLIRLTSLEIEGFKSFRDKMVIGPLAEFTCIIGPNGCGKSVVGEAIAFALGGNRKMLRAGSLASLMNQERRAEGCKTAQVTLHLDLLPHTPAYRPKLQPAGNPAQQMGLHDNSRFSVGVIKPTAAAAKGSTLDQNAATDRNVLLVADVSADAEAAVGRTDGVAAGANVQLPQHQLQDAVHQQQDLCQEPQWLGIRRTLRGSSTVSHIKRPGSSNWSPISQADLQTELALYNIQTEAVDRYIVTQSRQAVDVADAVKLVNHLELLTGAGDSADRIQEQSKIAEMLAAKIDHTQQQISSLETERDQLAPHVAHWQKVQQMEAEFSTAKMKLLQDQQKHGSRLITYQQDQVCKVQEAAAAASVHHQDLQQQEQQLQQQENSLNQQIGNCRKKEVNLGKKVEKLTAAAASTKVQLSSAESAVRNQQVLAQKLQARIDKLLVEEADHKQHITQLHQQAQVLQQARTTAQQQLAAEQKAAAAAAAAANRPTSTHHLGNNLKPSSAVVQLQQHFATAEAESAQLQAAKAAAIVKATRAAAAVAAVAAAIQEIDAAAAKTAREVLEAEEGVRSAAAAADAGMLAAQQAEQQWKEAHWQQRNLQDQLRAAEAELQQYHTEGSYTNIQHQHHSTPAGRWPAYDNAVKHLHQTLPSGSFFGRLYNCIAITDGAAAAAVNSALQEICDLNRTLIVSDRQAASTVVNFFWQQRIGTVQCKILAEVASSSRAAAAAGSRSSSSSSRAQSLLEFVTVAVGLPAGFRALLDQMLGGWMLVGDRHEASKLLHLRKNLVTRSGEVFKADGEIVVNMAVPTPGSSSSSNHPYALQIGQPAPAGHKISGATAAAAAAAAACNSAAAAALATAAQKEVQQLQHQLAAAQQQTAAADQQLRESRSALMLQQQQLATAERSEQSLIQKRQDQAERAATAAPDLQQQLAAAQAQQQKADQAVAAAAAAAEHAEQQQQQVAQQLQALTGTRVRQDNRAPRDSSSSSVCGSAGDRDLGLLSSFSKATEAAAAADAAVADVWQQADKVKQQQSRVGSRAAALRKELEKVQKSAGNHLEVEQMKAKLGSITDQLQLAEADVTTSHDDKARLIKQLKPVRKQLMAASKARGEAETRAQEYQVELQQQQHYLSRIVTEQQQRQAALQELLPQQQQDTDMQDAVDTPAAAAVAATKGESVPQQQQQLADMDCDVPERNGPVKARAAAAAGVGKPRAARRDQKGGKDANSNVHKQRGQRSQGRRAAIINDDSDVCGSDQCHDSDKFSNVDELDNGSSGSSSSNSDEDQEGDQRNKGHARKPSKQQQKQQQQQHKAKPELSSTALIKQGKQLQQQEQQLNEQEDILRQQRSKVNEAALDRDLAVLQAMECALGQLQQQEQQHGEAVATREQLMDERYTKLWSVLQRLNVKLDDVYKQLTGGAGSAYCAYTQERRLLFSQGVTLHVQPDGKTWRQFSMLSGGQQALATLALSFALQALSPSPFYFFDEVDCALDSLAAGRVAAYVKAQCDRSPAFAHCSSASTATEASQDSKTAAVVRSDTGGSRSANTSGSGVAAQYLLVSHRPVVFESASCLLGVYSNGRGSSAAVVAHFPDVGAPVCG